MIRAHFMPFNVDAERELSEEDDAFVMQHVTKKLQALDHDLFHSKWFDYRRMTPIQATFSYIKDYGTIFRRIYARELDRDRAQYITPIGSTRLIADLAKGETKAKRRLSEFWRGRQVADALGMPYEVYLEYAFTYRMRRWNRAYMPQPGHLYHEYDVEKIQERWEELQQSRLYLPDDPAFLVQNYRDIPYQNDFHEYLFKQARNRTDTPRTLANLIEQDLLPIDKCASRLEAWEFEQVESYLG